MFKTSVAMSSMDSMPVFSGFHAKSKMLSGKTAT